MNAVVSNEHLAAAQKFRQTYSVYQQNKDLINVGAYAEGSSPEVDESIRLHSSQQEFLRQDRQEAVTWENSLEQLAGILQHYNNSNENDVSTQVETPLVPTF